MADFTSQIHTVTILVKMKARN